MANFKIRVRTVIPAVCKIVVDGKSIPEILGKARTALQLGLPCYVGRQEIPASSNDLSDIKMRTQRTVGSSHDVLVTGTLPVISSYEVEADDLQEAQLLPVDPEVPFKYGSRVIQDIAPHSSLQMESSASPGITVGTQQSVMSVSSGISGSYVAKNTGLTVVIAMYPDSGSDVPTGELTMKTGISTTVGTSTLVDSGDGYSTATFTWATPDGWLSVDNVRFEYPGDVNFEANTLNVGTITATPYNTQFTSFVETPSQGSTINSGDSVQITGSVIYNASTVDTSPADLPAGTIIVRWDGIQIQEIIPGAPTLVGSGKTSRRDFSFTTPALTGGPGEITLTVIWRDDDSTNYNDSTRNMTYTVS